MQVLTSRSLWFKLTFLLVFQVLFFSSVHAQNSFRVSGRFETDTPDINNNISIFYAAVPNGNNLNISMYSSRPCFMDLHVIDGNNTEVISIGSVMIGNNGYSDNFSMANLPPDDYWIEYFWGPNNMFYHRVRFTKQ